MISRHVCNSLIAIDLTDEDDLSVLQTRIDKDMFHCSLQIKKLLLATTSRIDDTATPSGDGKGVSWRFPSLKRCKLVYVLGII